MAVRRHHWRVVLGSLLLCGVLSLLQDLSFSRARAASSTIVISQIYGGGGNSGAQYKNDFIELFNRGSTTVNLAGWSVQYASATGSAWSVTAICASGTCNLAPGQYFLTQEGSGGSTGVNLPTPDATGSINLSATAGKIALANNATALSGNCPTGGNITDFVGYGTTADCYEGSRAPAPSNTTAILRGGNSCTDNDNNSADFSTAAPSPRNSASTLSPCSSPATNTPTATATNTPTSTSTPTSTATSTSTPTKTPTSTSTNTLTRTPFPARAVVINEIAWGGTAASANDEWIELFNTTSAAITLTGWTLSDGGDIAITLNGTIPANGYFLLERTSDSTISNITADQIYTGGLSNSGETLSLRDPASNIIDTANGDGGAWSAGSGSPNYSSMERKNPLTADSDANWASNDGVTRNGLDASGNAINGTPRQPNTAMLALTATPTPTKTNTPTPTPTRTLTPTPTATIPVVNLLITEVLYDGTQTEEGDEFIGIYNPTAAAVDLSYYKIGDEETSGGGEGMYVFPSGATLAPGAIVVVAKNAAQFFNRFGFHPNYELVTSGGGLTDTASVPNLSKYTAWASGSLSLANDGDEVLLLGPSNQIVDSVAWENGNFTAVGLGGDASANEPRSLQRYGTQDSHQMTFDFLADTPAPGTRVTPPAFPAALAPAPMPGGMAAYWGDLHAHSTASDGRGPPRMAFDTARSAGLHFFALTEHDSWLTTEEWNEIGSAATAATIDNTFIALRAFEYSHTSQGHLNVFNTTTWVSRSDPNYDTLSEFYAWLAAQPDALAQFNHPDPLKGGNFNSFAFNAAASAKIVLQEWGNNAHFVYARYEAQYLTSLGKGWHVAPTNNSDNHDLNWGSDTAHRVGALMPALTLANLLEAFRARRAFSTEDANLALGVQVNGAWMGSTVSALSPLNFTITVSDPDPEPAQVFLYDNGTLAQSQAFANSTFTWSVSLAPRPLHFYYVQVVQADGDIALSAPIWTDNARTPTPRPPATSTPSNEALSDNRRDRRVSIASARVARSETNVEVEGCITVPPNVLSDRFLYVQDGSGGIKIALSAKRTSFPELHLGDCISLRGRVRILFGERQVEVDDLTNLFVRGTGDHTAPVPINTGAINASIEGQLVQIGGTIVSVQGNAIVVNDGSGEARVIIDATTGIRLPRLTRGLYFQVIGVVGRVSGRIAVQPRYATDLFPALATPTRTPTRVAARLTPTSTLVAIIPRATNTAALARATATRTPTLFLVARSTVAPLEANVRLSAEAFAVVGGSTSVAFSAVMFALGLIALRRK